MLIRFLVDYGDVKTGTVRNTKTDEDAATLIESKVAEKYVATEDAAIQKAEDEARLTDEAADKVMAKLKTEAVSKGRLPAEAVDKDKVSKGPYPTAGFFYKAVMAPNQEFHNWNEHRKQTGMSEIVNADGGFLIPQEYSMALLEAIAQQGIIAPRCRNFPVNHNLNLPFLNVASQATSWTGGVTVYKPAEGGTKHASLPQKGRAELRLNKMAAVIYATDELLQDAPIALETFLTTLCATEFSMTKDEDIINGSGAGEALGVMNAPCLVTQAREATQAVGSATIITENIVNMWSRLSPRSAGNAIWLANPDTFPQLATLTLNVGTGGSAVGLLQVNGSGIAGAPYMTLLGRPLFLVPHCQTCGTVGDIILGDFSQYVTISKAGQEMQTATSIHLQFLTDQTAFRFVIRFDGQPWWATAIIPKHGLNTYSPFVALATR